MIHYWRKQTPEKPLFSDIEWNKPERRDMAGRLGIVGGNKLGFAGVAESYSTALGAGAGRVRVLLPDALRKSIPPIITDAVFSDSTSSGSLGSGAIHDLRALGDWSTGILLAGDCSRNSETATCYEQFILKYDGQLTITRDAVDLVRHNAELLLERPNTCLVVSFAQLQKMMQSIYYPKMIAFSMQLAQFVEALHAFTLSYPTTIVTLHKDFLVVAHDGQVVTQQWDNPMYIWRGTTAARAASYLLWAKNTPLDAVVASAAPSS